MRWGRGGDGPLSAAGACPDGGYWTLAATRHVPGLLDGIDWGSVRVYDQTRRRAERLGYRWHALPGWEDVDHPADLSALRHRLRGADAAEDPALARLLAELDAWAPAPREA